MPNHYTPEFKKHHVEAWRASGLTRRQYCQSQAINAATFKHWPAQIQAKQGSADKWPALLPIHIAQPAAAEALATPVMVYLPNGYRVACQPAQLADIFRALNHAEA